MQRERNANVNGGVMLLELRLDALSDLLGPTARRELTEGEGEAFGDARCLEALGRDAFRREAQVDEVLSRQGNGYVMA